MRSICPECGSSFLRNFRAGTQQLEEELGEIFPELRILRMDADTTKTKESHTKILSSFAEHEADVLIGTQMIVKGHDFPDVTLVGIIAADLSLHVADFRAAERTFQLLVQAAGRAGRDGKMGHVVIQTYDPDHYSIRDAAAQDYESFYEREIYYRSSANYPPAGRLETLHISGPDKDKLDIACGYLRAFAARLAERGDVQVLGPADEPVARVQDIYRKTLSFKGSSREYLERMRDAIAEYIRINTGFNGMLVQFESN